MRKEKLSAQVLLGLGDERIQDAEVPQLQVYRAKRNGITFVLYAKIGGRPVRRVIGVYPTIGIEEARQLTRDLVLELREEARLKRRCSCDCHHRRKPLPPDLQSPKTILLGHVFEHYFKNHVLVRCRTFEAIRRNFDRYFGAFTERPAFAITPLEVQAWHNRLRDLHGVATANRSLQLLRALYNYGINWQLLDCRNPAKAVKRFPERSRERFLSLNEIEVLLAAIDRAGTDWTRSIFKLCLFTGQRIANVSAMRWKDIDFEQAVWTIPADHFKTGVAHRVPLVPAAVEVLRAQPVKAPYVFPARRGESEYLKNPYKAWESIIKESGLSDLRPHDLRRTVGTWQAMTGASLVTIARTLGHRDFKSTAVYARLPLDTVRDSMNTAVDAMTRRPGHDDSV